MLLGLCAVLAGSRAAAADRDEKKSLGEFFASVDVPSNVSTADVERVVRFVADNRRWVFVSQEDGVTRLSLEHGGIQTEASFVLHEGALALYHTTKDSRGEPVVPKRWLRNLLKDIADQFDRKR